MTLGEYDPKVIEPKWQREWERLGVYRFDPKSQKPIYSIDTPPPYASAYHLHMGHAMHYSQFEFMARFWRMNGRNVFFPIGFDDNGLPTEKHVEQVYNIDKGKVSREEFKRLCMVETEKIEEEFMRPMFKHLGFSCDWKIFYRTIDAWCQRVAQMSFLDLYEKGLVYRSKEPTLWCPYHETALAQAEVEDLERDTSLNYIDFELLDGEAKSITIATTRPEFLPACVGIFVHPDDERHRRLVGKRARVPIFGQVVPIMADPKVDPAFGTGIVMICTFGDSTDIAWWKKHSLPLRICIDERGKLTETAGEYKGLSIEEARARIIADLEKSGYVGKKEKIKQTVGACWRCDNPVEFIVTVQWFIKTLDLKDELIKQGRKIKWHPDFYRKRYENWVENLAWDWCISRQRYFGIPIPAWYCEHCGNIIVARQEDLPVNPEKDSPPVTKCPKCNGTKFKPDLDVFDTWMTSSMTPQIATRWRDDEALFKRVFPMSMRPQAHDIIRTWAFYTILKAWLHHREIPWRDVMMSGHGLDEHGKGMSKSRGNIVLPEEVIAKYSADAIRFWAASVTLGDDLAYREKDVANGQRFLTKLWNASRFAAMHIKGPRPRKAKLELLDRWLLSGLREVIEEGTRDFEGYQYSKTKARAEHFFWHDFCDDYIEMAKHRLYNPKLYGEASRRAAQYTLYTTLLACLKLFAPIVPHITEEIYQGIFKKNEKDVSLHVSSWPRVKDYPADRAARRKGAVLRDTIARIRRYKADKGMPLNQPLRRVVLHAAKGARSLLAAEKKTIVGAMQIKELELTSKRIEAVEKVIEIVPDFSKLGPDFKDSAGAIAEQLRARKEEAAEQLKEKGVFEIIVRGKLHKVLPRHIKETRREIKGEGEGDVIEVPEHGVTMLIIL